MYCKNCGAQLPDNAEFCSECGAKVEKPYYNYNEQYNYENFDTFDRTKEFNYNENGNRYYTEDNGNRYYTEDIYNNNINSNKNNSKRTVIIVSSVIIIAAAAIVAALVLIFGFPTNKSELAEENLYSAIKSEMSELNDMIETDEISEAEKIETDFVPEDENAEESEKIKSDTKDKPTKENEPESEEKEEYEESSAETDNKSEEKSSDKNTDKNTEIEKSSNDYGTAVVFDTDYVTMRSAGHMSASEKLKLYSGDSVTIKSIDENGYFKVDYNGKEGYVVPSYLSLNEDAVKKIKSQKTYTVITDYITLRDIPSTSGEELDKIYTGAELEYFSEAQDGFCLVRYNGRFGYVLKKYNGETLLR